MMNDRELRDAFQLLRASDQADTPEFGRVMSRKAAPVVTRWGMGTLALATAAAFAGIAIAVATNSKPETPAQIVVPADVIALSNWKPMTDALLSGPYAMPLQDEPLDTPKLPDTSSDSSSN